MWQQVARDWRQAVVLITMAAGLTEVHYHALEALGNTSQILREIAQSGRFSRSRATSVADELERRGLVQRTRSRTGDRRVVLLEITPEGRAVLHLAQTMRAGVDAEWEPKLRAALAEMLETMG